MPEDKSSVLAISRTVPFRRFQSRLGHATYRLNTIFVGLEHVANGVGKLESGAAVSWTKPANEKAAKQAADQARIFACSAALALAVDVIDQYLSTIVQVRWLGFPDDARVIATKATTRSAANGGAYSLAERAKAIADHLNLNDATLMLALLELLAKWRNATIHGDDRHLSLSSVAQQALKQGKQHMHDYYSHFDVDLAVKNFREKKLPVAKEITSLIAASQNFFRQIDETAIKKAAGTEPGIKHALHSVAYDHFFGTDQPGVLIASRMSEFMRGEDHERRDYLLKAIGPFGITSTTSPVSASLGNAHLDEILAMDRAQLIERLTRTASQRPLEEIHE